MSKPEELKDLLGHEVVAIPELGKKGVSIDMAVPGRRIVEGFGKLVFITPALVELKSEPIDQLEFVHRTDTHWVDITHLYNLADEKATVLQVAVTGKDNIETHGIVDRIIRSLGRLANPLENLQAVFDDLYPPGQITLAARQQHTR